MRLDLNSDAAVAVARCMCELDGWKLIISGYALSGMLSRDKVVIWRSTRLVFQHQ